MISVVIPAYNEEKTLGRCLRSLAQQYTSLPYEIIVVDNNSTDNTQRIAQTYLKKMRIRVIPERRKGRGAARRAGFRVAKGEVILSTDADAAVPPNWVETLATTLLNKPYVAITGTSKVEDSSLFVNHAYNLMQPMSMIVYRLFFGHYWLSGFNFGIRRDIYMQSGGFDPDLNVQEDIDLSFRVARLGRILFLPTLAVVVSGRRYSGGFLRGALPYVSTFYRYYMRGKKDIILSDIR